MGAARGQFSSRFGFVLAAAGSAVGLGNIWGFPTQVASHGGAAFVLVYILLAFALAYPALMAELIIGRHTRANVVCALGQLSTSANISRAGRFTGFYAVLIASLILSFYSIVAGWMLAYLGQPLLQGMGMNAGAQWLTQSSSARDLLSAGLFSALTAAIIAAGVHRGIERWSSRLMPLLIAILALLIGYVMTQPGAGEGLRVYLQPDFAQINSQLLLSAMGQAFFSLSLGVGTMLVYGSYLSADANLPRTGAMVTLIDVGIAFMAGLLIVPAIFVAQHYGAEVFSADGQLIAGPDLIFQVLPSLFDSMGRQGLVVASAFFALMVIASLTSSISMLEVPVSLIAERSRLGRKPAAVVAGLAIYAVSVVIILNFTQLFGLVIDLTTKYSEPLLGALFCLFAGWVLRRDQLLGEIRQGLPAAEHSLFWKIWPFYVRLLCPLLIVLMFAQSL